MDGWGVSSSNENNPGMRDRELLGKNAPKTTMVLLLLGCLLADGEDVSINVGGGSLSGSNSDFTCKSESEVVYN